jgi:hypothetical protein
VTSQTYADFHRPAYRDPRWLETCWFSFFEPNSGLRGHLRAAFRSNLDVAHGMVNLYSQGGGVLDMDFFDSQMHLPMAGNRYSDFSLANGLSVRGRPAPDAYCVAFKSRCGRVDLKLEYQALTPPLDLEATRIGTTEQGFAAFHRAARGDVPVGHIDQTFRVRGTLKIDGDSCEIRCVSNHDHSWSPRAEYRNSCGTFDVVHFDEELTLLVHASERELGRPVATNGYILRGTEVRQIRSAHIAYARAGVEPHEITYDLVDCAGERYEITAPVAHSLGQDQGSNGFTIMSFFRPRWNGRVGVGESMWHWDIPYMQRLIRAARRVTPGLTTAAALAGGLKK